MEKKKFGSRGFYVSVALLLAVGAGIAGKVAYDDAENLQLIDSWVLEVDYSDPALAANHPVFESQEWSDYVSLIDPDLIYAPEDTTSAIQVTEEIFYPWNKAKANELIEVIRENEEVLHANPALVFSGYPVTDASLVKAVEYIRQDAEATNVPFETLVEEWDLLTERERYSNGEETEEYILELIFSEDFDLKDPTEANKQTVEKAIKYALLELNKEENLKSSLDAFDEVVDKRIDAELEKINE